MLFAVYMDDLSKTLITSNVGCSIDNVCVNHVFYADDLCLMAPSPAGLQKLMDICYDYSITCSIKFNPLKSVCVVFKPNTYKLTCHVLYLGDDVLLYVKRVNYLGFLFTSDIHDDEDMLKQLRTLYLRTNSILRLFQKCNSTVKLELFRSFASCFYCPYFWMEYKKKTFHRFRVAYNNIHRRILSLPRMSSASNMYVINNVLNFEALLRKCTNSFITRISLSENGIIQSLLSNNAAKTVMWQYWYDKLY
jgi:hypothetical protein